MNYNLFRIFPLLLLAVSVFFGACGNDSEVRQEHPRQSVVVLHSWDSVGEEKELFTDCMEKAFQKRGMDVDIHHIYLDMIKHPGDVFAKECWPSLREEIKKLNPKVILLNDDPIYEWVLMRSERDSVFLHTPTVFSGVNAPLRDSVGHFPNMTGFEDRIDLERNIELMGRIAKARSVTIELGYRIGDSVLRDQFREVLRDSTRFINNEKFWMEYLDDDYLEKNYPRRTLVSFVSTALPFMNKGDNEPDSMGKFKTSYYYHHAKEMCQLQVRYSIASNSIISHTGRPQFTCIREQFNNPRNVLFLCGYFTSTEIQVDDQVSYAVRILKGEMPKSLPISQHTKDYYMDWNAMQMMSPQMRYAEYCNNFQIVNAPSYLDDPLWFSLRMVGFILLAGIIIYGIVYFMIRWRWKGQMGLVEELQHEEKIHDLMFSDAKDTFWSYKDGQFILDQQFADYFNLASTRLSLEEVERMIHKDSQSSFKFLLDFRNQRGRKTVRLRLSPDGGTTWYWAEIMYTATEQSAHTGELYGLLMNIDKKKEVEEQLERAQELASQVALKENFLANISHDLRTPLGAVTGFSSMLTTPGMVFEEGEREQYGEIIHQNTDMILNMIDSVMVKAQIETGDLEIIQKPTSVRTLVDGCYQTNKVIAPTHLKFNLEMAEPDATVNIDAIRTKQVINNFLSNAFKFTTEGSVTLGWKYMEDDDSQIEVYVRDTGIGIESEKKDKLFERYIKVNEVDKGTGLGLNISKTIMEKQNGTIGVDSEFGKGSKFFFRLTRMVECLVLCFILAAGALLPSSCTNEYRGEQKTANVLIYHSYAEKYSCYGDFNDKILQTFRKNGINANIQHVYLDLFNPVIQSEETHLSFRDSMTTIGWKPDIVLVEGDRAAHDFMKWREQNMVPEFDSIPVVMGSLHHPEWKYIRLYKNVVVINDPIDYCTNINLASDMSGKKCVEIELDYFVQDSMIRNELRQAIARPPYVDNSDFHIELKNDEQLSSQWADSVVVLVYSAESPERNSATAQSDDANLVNAQDEVDENSNLQARGVLGNMHRNQGYENLRQIYIHAWRYPSLAVKRDIYSSAIADKTGVPQYTAVKAGFADGSGRYLCGYFASYETVGEDMARVASDILRGKDIASLVGLSHAKNHYMDYAAMEKLGLEYDDYKDRFIIVGAPIEKISPVYAYASWIVIITVFLIAIFSIILVLQSWRNRTMTTLVTSVKRRAEMRQMALRGADSHMVRTEDNVREILSHVHPEHSAEIPLIMQSIDIAGVHVYEIYADVDQKDEYKWWQLRFAVVFDGKTRKKNVDGILINIEETKRYEHDLRQAMLLAEEAKQKEDFLTTISHEIRTPLNAVVGFSDVLVSMPADSFTPEELAECAKIIKTNNACLTTMIEDILMFSRIESGRIQYVKNEFDSAELVRELIYEWSDMMPEGVKLMEFVVQKGAIVNNDRTRVKYILNQLVGNAAKFTKSGLIVVGMTYHLNSDQVEFFVRDTGCGIPREKQQLSFGLFWKDDGFVPGLGLGLHVAKKLADGMGLRLDVESREGVGSKFSLYSDVTLKCVTDTDV